MFLYLYNRNYLRRSRHLKGDNRDSTSSHQEDKDIEYDEPNISKVTPKEILSFAWQICNGMAYLSDIKVSVIYLIENLEDEREEDISPLNYLSRAQSYEKCEATDKILNEEVENLRDGDINFSVNTQGYETPVKFPRKVKTPTNEDPQDYTDMGGKCK
ncbi:hypothetical protein NQ317_007077 [Molorchus minor]|uniref:Uncharacterized protein n=1 Tax=Molorchus minor TaxID=1323400 RepID=A0ABQ9K4L3_9CUCU|nr:hypothetical protein NQ317_007077 [Molorchus minor]